MELCINISKNTELVPIYIGESASQRYNIISNKYLLGLKNAL